MNRDELVARLATLPADMSAWEVLTEALDAVPLEDEPGAVAILLAANALVVDRRHTDKKGFVPRAGAVLIRLGPYLNRYRGVVKADQRWRTAL